MIPIIEMEFWLVLFFIGISVLFGNLIYNIISNKDDSTDV